MLKIDAICILRRDPRHGKPQARTERKAMYGRRAVR